MKNFRLVILGFFIDFMISQGFTEAKIRPSYKIPCPSVTPSPSVTESAILNNEL